MLFNVSMVDGSLLEDNKVFITIRTIPAVPHYIGCGEKTVRRALKNNGIVKKRWLVKLSPLVFFCCFSASVFAKTEEKKKNAGKANI